MLRRLDKNGMRLQLIPATDFHFSGLGGVGDFGMRSVVIELYEEICECSEIEKNLAASVRSEGRHHANSPAVNSLLRTVFDISHEPAAAPPWRKATRSFGVLA